MAALRLGTRGSALAVAQSSMVAGAIEALGREVELVRIRTSGDERVESAERDVGSSEDVAGSDVSRSEPPGGAASGAVEDKARFVKELEQGLLDGEIDLAVHSAKDVPGELPDGLAIVGVPARADARDALCARGSSDGGGASTALGELRPGAVVGTASLRRQAQLRAARPDLDVRDLRGNVDTRLRKLASGELDAIVLAIAGLIRLDRAGAGRPLPADLLVPAAGQGCLALEARAGDAAVRELAERLTDSDALAALTAERALVVAIEATCRTPVGAHATVDGDALRLSTFVGTPDGAVWIRDEVAGDRAGPEELGAQAARRLLAAGAADILASAEAGTA
ncbi:MAG: hydroxymethylbilane synthase [Thermoleophilaceae bacterium]